VPPQLSYSPAADDGLRLVELDRGNFEAVLRLPLAARQRAFVVDNAFSVAQAHFQDSAWFRAVYLKSDGLKSSGGDTPVGFVMLYDPRCGSEDDAPYYPLSSVPTDGLFLWRLMIAESHQGLGLGRQMIALLARLTRANGFAKLYLSYVDAPGGPGPFYARCGFVTTGRIVDGEVEAVLDLHG